MNKSRQNVNNGTRSIAKREWEAKQARIAAEQAHKVKVLNAAAIAAMSKGVK